MYHLLGSEMLVQTVVAADERLREFDVSFARILHAFTVRTYLISVSHPASD